MSKWFAIVLAGAFCVAPAARAGVTVAVAGNTATADIELAGVEAELILTFDDATNLSAQSLGISAETVSLDDVALLARLPPGGLASLPSALPLLITVEPPALGGLSLRNTVRAEIHTHALPYAAGSSFRLFKAPLNGAFRDITDEVAPGSVRARGTTGGFSQFLILPDLRETDDVVAIKVAALRNRIDTLPDAEQAGFGDLLDTAQAAIANESWANAIAAIDSFRARAADRAGTQLTDEWRATRDGDNQAGDLIAGAATLRFSVAYLRDYGN